MPTFLTSSISGNTVMVMVKVPYTRTATMKFYEEAPYILTAVEGKKVKFSLCSITATTGL
jgi:hypothetical protein